MHRRPTHASLAIDGGSPTRSKPWPPWPVFAEDEIDAVRAVLQSGHVNYWTGDVGRRFEVEYAKAWGMTHAVALANGTLALEIGLEALALGPGDEVIVPARTFAASGAAVVRVGATPVFADVDFESGCVDVASLEAARTSGTRAVIVVHLGGWPADMPAIAAWCQREGLHLIEDCAQAHGATIGGRAVGSWGDVAAFSFCQDKILTTGGEGGMLLCRDDALWRRAWALKDHGKSWDAVYKRDHGPGFRWLHESIGTNARMTEMQAAIGLVQLQKLPAWVARRRHNAQRLARGLAIHPALRVPFPDPPLLHAAYRFYAYVRSERLNQGWNRDRILEAVEREGIPCRSGSCGEIYLERAFASFRPVRPLPVARALAEQSLCFLVHPTLSDDDIDDVLAAVARVLVAATHQEEAT